MNAQKSCAHLRSPMIIAWHSCGSIAVPKSPMHIAKARSYPYANERQLGGLIGSS